MAGLRSRLDRLEKSARPVLQDTYAPLVDAVLRQLSDEEVRLMGDALQRVPEGEEYVIDLAVSPEEQAAFERFETLYEEERRGL